MSNVGRKSSRLLWVPVVLGLPRFISLPRPTTAQTVSSAPPFQPVAGAAGTTADNTSAAGTADSSGSASGTSMRVPDAAAAAADGARSSIAKAPPPGQERPAHVASTDKPVLKGLEGGIRATVRKLHPTMMRALDEFKNASASFPSFCRDWERKLRDRERDNLAHIDWRMLGGVETGSYVGYGAVDSCLCK